MLLPSSSSISSSLSSTAVVTRILNAVRPVSVSSSSSSSSSSRTTNVGLRNLASAGRRSCASEAATASQAQLSRIRGNTSVGLGNRSLGSNAGPATGTEKWCHSYYRAYHSTCSSSVRSRTYSHKSGTSLTKFQQNTLTRPPSTSSSPHCPIFPTQLQQQRQRQASHFSTTAHDKMPSSQPYTTTSLTASDLTSLLANRRSYYKLDSSSPIPDSQIQSILAEALKVVPSAFNTQSTRLVLALGSQHKAVWDTTSRLLRQLMGEEAWAKAPTGSKIASFGAAHGTVLFYEDQADLDAMKAKFSLYADHFDAWSEHADGMHQLAVWAALEAEGLGANLQHYNGVIDDDVAKMFDLPKTWKLRGQLVFGGVADAERPAEKDKKPTETVLKVFGLDEK